MILVSKLKKRFYFVAASYFRFFANFALRRWRPRIIAITGSVGKTTMLHLIEYQLGRKAHYSHNANSAFGIAFDLVNLRGVTGSKLRWLLLIFAVPIKALFYTHTEKFYIVEIDGERPHEAEFLARWLRPEVTLWISLGRSHAVQFQHQVTDGTFENIDKAITHEFAMLPQYTTKQIYIDASVPLMQKAIQKIQAKHQIPAAVVSCDTKKLTNYTVLPDHTEFIFHKTKFCFAAPLSRDIALQLIMLQHLCDYLAIPLRTDCTKLNLPPGRNSYFSGKNGLKLIDSSYNAHLISVQSILKMMREMQVSHKWLVIGDMVEQGSIEAEEHHKLAELIVDTQPEQVILVGRRTKKYTAPLLKKMQIRVFTTTDPREALKFIEQNATGQETIVFKGSQYLEWIIEKLLLDPRDAALLPRREPGAVKRRQKRGLN